MISVVVPTYNREKLLKRCLNSLMNQSYEDYEIIVVDDGSIDGTRKTVGKFQKESKIRYFRQTNQGHSMARNLGFRKAKGEIIASTDDDCTVKRDWLNKISETFERYPWAAAIGGGIINPTDSKIAWAQYILNYSSWFPAGRTRVVKDIPTCNIAYKKEEITELKFSGDRKMFAYKDSLFNHGLIKKGKKIVFNPKIIVYHNRWEMNGDMNAFFAVQKRHGKGFVDEGYKVHGIIGKTLFTIPFLNLLSPRLILVFLRSLKSKKFLFKFIINFPLILMGEFEFGLFTIKNRSNQKA